MEAEFTVKVTYDWDRITQDEITHVIDALPGVSDTETVVGSVTEPESSMVRFRVEDNTDGEVMSSPYVDREVAEHICASLNTSDGVFKYGVYTNQSGKWRRDESGRTAAAGTYGADPTSMCLSADPSHDG